MDKEAVIERIEIYQLQIPLIEPFVISLGPIYKVQNVVVKIETDTGIAGFGECSPYMTINGESMDTCFIVGQYLAKTLKGKNALQLEECMIAMDKVIHANTSIKSAFDIALYDIAAQHAGKPLYKFLGGEKTKRLQTDMTVSIGEPQKMKDDAVKFKAQGFEVLKVKLGGKPIEDIERIKAIRSGIGNDLPMRIDANQGWSTIEDALFVLNAIAPYNIQYCEEPIPRWMFMDLHQLSSQSPIPIMADECCFDHHDAQRLIDLNACSMINIKLGKSSGFTKAMKIVELAANKNMPLQIGGFMESRLGMTAAAHLALTNDCIRYCDFDTPLMFTEDPVVGGIKYQEKGVIEVPDLPGLGASIHSDYLENAKSISI